MRLVTVAALLTLCLTRPAAANLIVNGNFESGNTGFTTDYKHQPGAIGAERSYDIVTSPYPAHPSAADYGDHTSGSGYMFAGNGALDANKVVWSQTVAISANTDYDFSMWMSSWVSANPSTFDVLFNDVSIGTPAAPTTTAIWKEFATSWNSGVNTSLTIKIIETRRADVGSDFALDDISLETAGGTNPVPEPSSLLMAAVGAGVFGLGWLVRKRRVAVASAA